MIVLFPTCRSTESGCASELVCCRVQGDSPSPETESYQPSSEFPQISSSTQEPNIENNGPCTCVNRNQCLPPNGSNARQDSNIR